MIYRRPPPPLGMVIRSGVEVATYTADSELRESAVAVRTDEFFAMVDALADVAQTEGERYTSFSVRGTRFGYYWPRTHTVGLNKRCLNNRRWCPNGRLSSRSSSLPAVSAGSSSTWKASRQTNCPSWS